MLDSVPVPFQAIVWPLAGAVLILAVGRRLPNWARRLLAMTAALASLVTLWSLQGVAVERVEMVWEPLNFFRMSPALYPDGLSLLVGIMLAGLAAACILGIQGLEPRTSVWPGLVLVALAGCLVMAMAANVLALALGSALIDVALLAFALFPSSSSSLNRTMAPSLAVPGIASTFALLLAALRMDAQVGHASLLAGTQVEAGLVLMGVAGLLRSLVFPLHPRGLSTPESAVALLLPAATGLCLLVRVQALMPVLTEPPWIMVVATMALLAGGLLTWSCVARDASRRSRGAANADTWLGILVHQTGFAIAFIVLAVGVTPWPLLSLALALGALVIWWDGDMETEEVARPGWLEWFTNRIGPWWTKTRSRAIARVPGLGRWRDSRLGRHAIALLAVVALISLGGAPFTIGARGRWTFYAAWLEAGKPSLLFALAADTFLVAGLWLTLSLIVKQAGEHRPRLSTGLALTCLIIPVVALGIAPGIVDDGLGLGVAEPADVSVWGLGLVYIMPWLLGAWLARLSARLTGVLGHVQEVTSLNWLYHAAGWLGQRLVGVIHWLGRVGEGEGWWGWALIILSLGAVLLLAR